MKMSILHRLPSLAPLCRRLAIPAVAVGVAWLTLAYALGWTRHNAVLLTGLLLVSLGILIYIIGEKALRN